MENFIEINNLQKIYSNKFQAIKNLNLNIKKGEIFALLGPNGAGKTTLINMICGIVSKTSGDIKINNYDIIKDYRKTRSIVGIVPQELTLEAFENVFDNVSYTRGLYNKPPNKEYITYLLKLLSLWDKKDNKLRELSGGMKRRVLIAKALSHEPKILFLDEPTASVDVELRRDMWKIVSKLKKNGVTIILTTHYIEEAEAIADRVGVINRGQIILVENKKDLIDKMGEKKLIIDLQHSLKRLPDSLNNYNLILEEGNKIIYLYDTKNKNTGITSLLQSLKDEGIKLKDINTEKNSLENIFINLVKGSNNELERH